MEEAAAGVENDGEDGEVIAGVHQRGAGDGIGSFTHPYQDQTDNKDQGERAPGVADLLRVQKGKGNAG